jgi:hypothetical protein
MRHKCWLWRVAEEGNDDALISVVYVVHRKNKRREEESQEGKKKETGIMTAILRQRLLEPKYI